MENELSAADKGRGEPDIVPVSAEPLYVETKMRMGRLTLYKDDLLVLNNILTESFDMAKVKTMEYSYRDLKVFCDAGREHFPKSIKINLWKADQSVKFGGYDAVVEIYPTYATCSTSSRDFVTIESMRRVQNFLNQRPRRHLILDRWVMNCLPGLAFALSGDFLIQLFYLHKTGWGSAGIAASAAVLLITSLVFQRNKIRPTVNRPASSRRDQAEKLGFVVLGAVVSGACALTVWWIEGGPKHS